MAVDRTNSDHRAEQKAATEDRPRSSGPPESAAASPQIVFSQNDPPAVRLSATSSKPGSYCAPPVPPSPPPRAAAPSGAQGRPGAAPAFTVPSFSASGSGNATLSKGSIFLGVNSPEFKSSATVQAPPGNQDV